MKAVHLFHESSLSITISILLWVKLIQQAWLAVNGVGSGVGGGRANTCTVAMIVMRSILLRQRRSAVSTGSTESSTNRARLAGECIAALLTTGEVSTLLLKLVHGDGWECGGGVVLGLVLKDILAPARSGAEEREEIDLVDFMDGDCRVDNGGLNCLLLDNWLDILMYLYDEVSKRCLAKQS